MSAPSPSVLVVDDEDSLRKLIAAMLEKAGFSALQASRGEAALDLLRQHASIRVLLADVVMPGMSGPELVDQARRMRPELGCLYISGAPLERRPGAPPVLRKPFTSQELVRAVQAVLA